MNFNFSILIIPLFFLFYTCKKEKKPTSWQSDIVTPLANAKFTLNNFLNDEYLTGDSNGVVHVVFKHDFYDLPLDSLGKIPDTTLIESLSIPFSINAPPGYIFYSNAQTIKLNASPLELSYAEIEKGFIDITIESNVPEKIIVTYNVPGAKKNNQSLNLVDTVPAAQGAKAIFKKTLNIQGYTLDLTGPNQNSYNKLAVNFYAQINPQASQSIPLSSSTLFKITTNYRDISPSYIKGYFGKETFKLGPDTAIFDQFSSYVSGALNLEKVKMLLRFNNQFGVDAVLKINGLTAINTKNGQTVNLSNNIIGQAIQLTRAIETGQTPPVYSVPKEYILDQNNSNIDQFFEIMPNRLVYDLELKVNPMGNISSGNDFLYKNYPFQSYFELDIPMSLTAQDLVLSDTIDLKINENIEWIDWLNGKIYLYAENFFPSDFEVSIQLFDTNKTATSLINNQGKINAAVTDGSGLAQTPVKSVMVLSLDDKQMQDFYHAGYLAFVLKLNTANYSSFVKFTQNNYLDLKLIHEAQVKYFIR